MNAESLIEILHVNADMGLTDKHISFVNLLTHFGQKRLH